MKYTYEHYNRFPYSKFSSYARMAFKHFGFSKKMLDHLKDYKINQHFNKLERNKIIENLIKLEEKDNIEFSNIVFDQLRELYIQESHSEFKMSDFNGSIESDYYKNPFTNRVIPVLEREEIKQIQCSRIMNRHLFADVDRLSFIEYNNQKIKSVTDDIGIVEGSFDYKLFSNYIILHEMAHDTDYQNYLLFKDYSMNSPITLETHHISENDADVLSMLMTIKIHRLTYEQAERLIRMVISFRSVINEKKHVDDSMKSLAIDSQFHHLTEHSLIIVLGLIKKFDTHFIFNMTSQDMLKLSFKILKESFNVDFKKNCIHHLLPYNYNKFLQECSTEKFRSMFNYYIISMYSQEDIVQINNMDEMDKIRAINYFRERFIRKLYDVTLDESNIDFRLKVSFEYAHIINDDFSWLMDSEYFESTINKF